MAASGGSYSQTGTKMFLWISATTWITQMCWEEQEMLDKTPSHAHRIHSLYVSAQHQEVLWHILAMQSISELLLHNSTDSVYIWIKQLLIGKILKLWTKLFLRVVISICISIFCAFKKYFDHWKDYSCYMEHLPFLFFFFLHFFLFFPCQ